MQPDLILSFDVFLICVARRLPPFDLEAPVPARRSESGRRRVDRLELVRQREPFCQARSKDISMSPSETGTLHRLTQEGVPALERPVPPPLAPDLLPLARVLSLLLLPLDLLLTVGCLPFFRR